MEATEPTVHQVVVDASDATYCRFIVDQARYRIRWEDMSPRLAAATYAQRACIDISPSGYGIHWPLVDEDLAVKPLMQEAECVND